MKSLNISLIELSIDNKLPSLASCPEMMVGSSIELKPRILILSASGHSALSWLTASRGLCLCQDWSDRLANGARNARISPLVENGRVLHARQTTDKAGHQG